MFAPWAPVTKPLETPSGSAEQLGQPAGGDILHRRGRRRGDDGEARSDPRRVASQSAATRRGQRAADHEAEVPAGLRADDARLGSGDQLREDLRVLGSLLGQRTAQGLDAARRPTPRLERAARRACRETAPRSRPSGRAGLFTGSTRLQGTQPGPRIAGAGGSAGSAGAARSRRARRSVNRRWPRTASSVDATASSDPLTSPAKMMWTTCFVVNARPGAIESTIAIGPSSGGATIPTSSAISRSSASISVSPE